MYQTVYQDDGVIELGVDEAGRGPLWGPMMAAAVIWPSPLHWTDAHRELMKGIKDSKKLSAKKREIYAKQIQSLAVAFGIGMVSAEEIDMLGATRSNQLAFRRACNACVDAAGPLLTSTTKRRILIDGILPLNDALPIEDQMCIIDGDEKYLSIAAASIVAKVAHDTWVTDWCANHVAEAARYDLLSCKGYGTAKHREGILTYGYTDLHRRLYLRKLIPDIVVSRYTIVDEELN